MCSMKRHGGGSVSDCQGPVDSSNSLRVHPVQHLQESCFVDDFPQYISSADPML